MMGMENDFYALKARHMVMKLPVQTVLSHTRIQKVLPEGSNFDNYDEGRYDPNTTISGPLSARQRNTI